LFTAIAAEHRAKYTTFKEGKPVVKKRTKANPTWELGGEVGGFPTGLPLALGCSPYAGNMGEETGTSDDLKRSIG